MAGGDKGSPRTQLASNEVTQKAEGLDRALKGHTEVSAEPKEPTVPGG